ncbi:MAG: DUF1249 domain-containing protein, partial [Endozoicomonas sp.]
MNAMNPHALKPAYRINLVRLQLLCEANYQRVIKLLPNLHKEDHHRLLVHHGHSEQPPEEEVQVDVIQRSPFTTLIRITMKTCWNHSFAIPETEVHLYHDVNMAEVVFRRHSQRLEPRYSYPNPKMHQPDEKEQHNRFLAEWLDYCHS